jgi:hypothetical protein
MKKIQEYKKGLEDIEQIINMLASEVDLLRNITYRYYLMHGNEIQDGSIHCPFNITFTISNNQKNGATCEMHDSKHTNLPNNFDRLQKLINNLN